MQYYLATHHSFNNPLDGDPVDEGGAPSGLYYGYLGQLFKSTTTYNTTTNQYRVLYVYNDEDLSYSSVKAYFTTMEHAGHLAMTTGGPYYYTGQFTEEPTWVGSWVAPTGYTDGLELGSMVPGSYKAIWLRLQITTGNDQHAFAALEVQGYAS